MQPYLIFTDLDGTLLDAVDYNFNAALTTLEKIGRLKIPLIINSSKTYAEINSFSKKLHNIGPFVVENGAAVFIPAGIFPEYTDPVNQVFLGKDLTKFIKIIHTLRYQHGFRFKGFSDFTVKELMAETGLTEIQSVQAKQRLATEPVKWLDTEENRLLFAEMIELHGLKLLKGGRFWHIMGDTDKSQAMLWLLDKYQRQTPTKLTTIAAGDSQNDKLMLEQADYSAVIRSVNGHYMQLDKASDTVIYSQYPAPQGWQEAIEQFMARLNIGEEHE